VLAAISKQISTLEALSKPITLTFEDTMFSYKNKREYKTDDAFRARIDELYEQNSTALNGMEPKFGLLCMITMYIRN
jgi:hypothetical protein